MKYNSIIERMTNTKMMEAPEELNISEAMDFYDEMNPEETA